MPAKPRPLFDLRDIPAAIGLLTRLPVKVNTDHAMARGAAAAWAYPIAGIAVGGLSILVGMAGLGLGLAPSLSAGLVLTVQALVTGAMHEDGLADCADGFWGGWTRKRRLEIMKDSRIGAYGVLALILGLGLKWAALSLLFEAGAAAWTWIICAAVLSRAAMVWIMATTPNARPGGLAARVGRPSRATAYAALGGAVLFTMLTLGPQGLAMAAIAWVLAIILARLAIDRIGGQTGDVLGGAQFTVEASLLIWATV